MFLNKENSELNQVCLFFNLNESKGIDFYVTFTKYFPINT